MLRLLASGVATGALILCSSALSAQSYANFLQARSQETRQVGSNWYPGTASGLAMAPVVTPGAYTESTGGSLGTGTWYCVIAYGNLNGNTTVSPQVSVTLSSGSTNLIGLGPGDFAYLTGTYKMQMYCGTANGGPYHLQTPYSRVYTIGTCTYYSGPPAYVTCDAGTTRHGLVDGDAIMISGNSQSSINAAQIITAVSEPTSGNSTFTFAYSGSSFTTGTGGAMSFYTGTPTESDNSCYINIGYEYGCAFGAYNASGAAPPSTNTATIDPLQVAVNETHTIGLGAYSITNGQGIVTLSPTTYTLTTPLILGWTRIEGPARDYTSQGGDTYPVIRDSGWAEDSHLGVLMYMGAYVSLKNFTIQSVGRGSVAPSPLWAGHGWPGGDDGSGLKTKGIVYNTSNNNAQTPAIHLDSMGIGYGWEFRDNSNIGGGKCGLATIYAARSSLSYWDWYGGRINAGCSSGSGGIAIKTRGGAPNTTLGTAGPANTVGIVFNLRAQTAIESTGSTAFDFTNGGLALYDGSNLADQIGSGAVDAVFRYGNDYWGSGGVANFGLIVGPNSGLGGNSYANSTVRWVGPVFLNGRVSVIGGNIQGSTGSGSSVWLDANSQNLAVFVVQSSSTDLMDCDTSASQHGNTAKIINPGSQMAPLCIGTGEPYVQTANTTNSVIPGITKYMGNLGTFGLYRGVANGGGSFNTWVGDPDTSGMLAMSENNNGGNGYRMTIYQNNGSTPFFDIYPAYGANQINLCNPPSPANGRVNIGCPLVDSTGATVKGALTGRTGSLGGGTLPAGTCATTTASVTGATTGMVAMASPNSDPGAGFYWLAFVSSTNIATVRVCATVDGTPSATTYSVRVIQ